jgi:hypothetical protein
MPDPGLVAVWRAMSIDATRWDDWDGFVDATPGGTIAEFVDRVRAATGGDGALELEVGENGVRLRACFAESGAELWQRLAVAWRLAADVGASGEFAWVPGDARDVAYRGVIADFSSRWERLTGASASELGRAPGRREVQALADKRGPRPAPRAKPADPAATPATTPAAARAKPAKKAASKPAAKKPAAKPAKKAGGKKR